MSWRILLQSLFVEGCALGFMRLSTAAFVFLSLLPWVSAARAMSLKECSTRYQAAKADGSLGLRTWKEFRAEICASATGPANASATPLSSATPPATAAAASAPAKPAAAINATPRAAAASEVAMTGLPSAIDPKYAAEKPSRGRLHTCSDAYRAAKKAGTLNGLRWIQPGGGFYSQCTRKLKAAGKA